MAGILDRLRRAYRRVVALPLLLLSARYHSYRGNRTAGKERLVRALAISPGSFTAHLRLGALYLQERDFYRAKREFLLAREIDPGRFRRLYPLVTGASGDVNINLFFFPGYTDREEEAAPKDFLRDFIGVPRDETEAESGGGFGDFASYAEFRKFQEMGPFREEDLEVDWDETERLFQQDRESLEN